VNFLVNFLALEPLTADLLPAIVELDRLCLGGLWTIDGYRRELESPNSDLLVMKACEKVTERKSLSKNRHQPSLEIGKQESENLQHRASSSLLSPLPSLLALGCIWSIADEAHITLLGVHPDYRNQGLGQLMLYALLNAAYQRELKWATLEVRVSNRVAIELYKKFQFKEVGIRKRYYSDQEDALVLWLNDLQNPNFRQTLQEWRQQIGDRLKQAGWKQK
jgi:ribosomal-protein-alanine N-acetyltransferase